MFSCQLMSDLKTDIFGTDKEIVSNRKCDVLNRGFSGYTTAFNKLILPKILQCDNSPKGSIAVAVVLLGSNDSILEDVEPRGISVEQYVTNLTDILTQFMNDGIAASQLVLLTPPAISEFMYEKHCREMGKQQHDVSILNKKAILTEGFLRQLILPAQVAKFHNTELGLLQSW